MSRAHKKAQAAKALARFRGRAAETETRLEAPQSWVVWQIGELAGLRFEVAAGTPDYVRWPRGQRAILASSHDGQWLYLADDADPFQGSLQRFAAGHAITGIVYKAERDGVKRQYFHVFDTPCQLEKLPTPNGFGLRYRLKGGYRMTQDGIVG